MSYDAFLNRTPTILEVDRIDVGSDAATFGGHVGYLGKHDAFSSHRNEPKKPYNVGDEGAAFNHLNIRYADIRNVIFNQRKDPQGNVEAAAVINLRAPDDYSRESGLDQHRTIGLFFIGDTQATVSCLRQKISDLSIPVRDTEFGRNVFKTVFLK